MGYAWGGSTGGWRGSGSYDYGSARARYDKTAEKMTGSRTYTARSRPDFDLVNPKGKTIKTNSKNPIVIGVDVTGSMATWPAEIFDRLPLLYQTLGKYREDTEIAFAAIGDATCDTYPLQVSDFSKKPSQLEKNLKALCPEGGGGGQIKETYELFGQFMNTRCETPNATSPFLIMFGDEQFYETINPNQVKHYIGDTIKKPIKSETMWGELMQKFNVFYLQKEYGSRDQAGITRDVKQLWTKALGSQRVIDLPNRERAVDVGLGLIAKHWGQYDDFGKSLGARHKSTSVKAGVHHSLRHIDATPIDKSVTTISKGTKTTKSLTA